VAYYQGVIDRTVRPRFPRHYERAPKSVRRWQAKLDWTTAYVNRLKAVHAKLPSPPSEAEIEAATETVRLRYEQLWGRFARIRGEDT
jgi:hypothetical protein